MKTSFWSLFFLTVLMLSVPSMVAKAETVSNPSDYIPSEGYKYEVYALGTATEDMNLTCSDSTVTELLGEELSVRNCKTKSDTVNFGGYEYYYNNTSFRVKEMYSDYYLVKNYTFPMESGKTYTKEIIDPRGNYSYSYTVESVNETQSIGNKIYENVIVIKNELGGYTYIAKNHGVILNTYKLNGTITKNYITLDYEKVNTPTPVVTTPKKYVTKSALNVRAGAGTKYRKIGTLKKGATVTVKGISSNKKWYKISYKGKTGYVSKSYVKVVTAPKKYVTKSALNVRAGAGTKYRKIGTLKKGATVTVKGTSSNKKWYKISYKGKTGYVSKSYVKVVTTPT